MADITFERRGALGLITLDRPAALNALTHAMALSMEEALADWAVDPAIGVVAIRGAGEKAFCAGGDIRALYDAGRPGGENACATFPFYADEYRLNTAIKRYAKPYVSLMDGVVMGGGVGVSVHAGRRVAGDRTLFAMPETGIGLIPDVGATYFLPRLPGETGMWLALTGARLQTADALEAGICDSYVPSERHGDLLDALTGVADGDPDAVDAAIASESTGAPGSAHLPGRRALIDDAFGRDSVEAVLDALAATGDPWASEQQETILQKSPTSTRLTFRQVREGASLEFEDCMRLEYRLVRFCMKRPDFYEGVRGTLIDRYAPPRWTPATLQEVGPAMVDEAFAPLGDEELTL